VRNGFLLLCLIGALGSVVLGQTAPSSQPATQPAERRPVQQYVSERVREILDAAETTGDFETEIPQLHGLFDQVLAHARENDLDALCEIDVARRLLNQLSAVPESSRMDTFRFLRARPKLCRTLLYLIKPQDDLEGVYAVLNRLRVRFEAQLETFDTLTAALCVVHDKPRGPTTHENPDRFPTPEVLFEYFARNERQMQFGIRNVPAELLIWVVDSTTPIEEMAWALRKYQGDTAVGKRFFDITYDNDAFRRGKPKKVFALGYTLPNILKAGGVCADQAYFAVAVGKSIGVPTAYVFAAGGDVSHAWVGFLQHDKRRSGWNFDMGRWEDYEDLRGNILDPQTGEWTSDAHVATLGEFIGTKVDQRQRAATLTAAARRLIYIESNYETLAPDPLPPEFVSSDAPPRQVGIDQELKLLAMALREFDGFLPAWITVRELAADRKLTPAHKQAWFALIEKHAVNKYPDFAHEMFVAMIQSSDLSSQPRLWEMAAKMFSGRPDLVASVRMNEAEMWEFAKNPAKAFACYEDIINRFANDGPFVLAALEKAEQLLRDSGRARGIPSLYDSAWRRITPPGRMSSPFMMQSNWYKVGVLYIAKLEEAGLTADAAKVRTKMDRQLRATAGS
jgi:hypothetical protein